MLEEYLEIGCEYIKKGLDPNAIELLMESLLYNIVKTKDVVEVDIFQLVLLKKLLGYYKKKTLIFILSIKGNLCLIPIERIMNRSY